MTDEQNIVHADPSKAFFVELLTRDITVPLCILDLVDNSIHNFIRDTKIDVMDLLLGKTPAAKIKTNISIQISKNRFTITDSSGGITINEAKNEVFLLGHPYRGREYTGLGVYGALPQKWDYGSTYEASGVSASKVLLSDFASGQSDTDSRRSNLLASRQGYQTHPSDTLRPPTCSRGSIIKQFHRKTSVIVRALVWRQ